MKPELNIVANFARAEIDRVLTQGRRDISTLSQPAVDAFVQAFRQNLAILTARYQELYEQAKAGNKTSDQLRKQLLPIKRQAEADFAYWQQVATNQLDDTVKQSWAAGVGMAGDMLDIKGASFRFATFDRMAYEASYIATQSGPVRRLLTSIALNASDDAINVLRNAIMEGINPRKAAKRLATAVSASLTRCETIARTESARAHKAGTLARYMEAGVDYVRWMSAEQMRTCPACWAMDGRVYKAEDVPNDHPNGRCVMEAMLDEDVKASQDKYGDEWQDKLWDENIAKNTGIMQSMTDEQLSHVFGSQRQIDAFRAGAPLKSAVDIVHHKIWGDSPQVKTIYVPNNRAPQT